MSTDEHAGSGTQTETAAHPGGPGHVPGKPGWYRTLDEAVHAWGIANNLHGEQQLPEIKVLLGSHIQGWKAL